MENKLKTTTKKQGKIIFRSDKRLKVISYLYFFELMELPLEVKKAFEDDLLTSSEIKIIENIAANYLKYKQMVSRFIVKNWSFERLNPLERAILIWGAFELSINEKNQTIYEIIGLTKDLIPDDTYKFINKILDEIGGAYERIKASKKELKSTTEVKTV